LIRNKHKEKAMRTKENVLTGTNVAIPLGLSLCVIVIFRLFSASNFHQSTFGCWWLSKRLSF